MLSETTLYKDNTPFCTDLHNSTGKEETLLHCVGFYFCSVLWVLIKKCMSYEYQFYETNFC